MNFWFYKYFHLYKLHTAYKNVIVGLRNLYLPLLIFINNLFYVPKAPITTYLVFCLLPSISKSLYYYYTHLSI